MLIATIFSIRKTDSIANQNNSPQSAINNKVSINSIKPLYLTESVIGPTIGSTMNPNQFMISSLDSTRENNSTELIIVIPKSEPN